MWNTFVLPLFVPLLSICISYCSKCIYVCVREFWLKLSRFCVSFPSIYSRQGIYQAQCGALRTFSMLRAARSATADHVRILLQQLLFFHRVKIAAMRLQHQLEETMDDLDDIGFDGQVLNSILRAAHLELRTQLYRPL